MKKPTILLITTDEQHRSTLNSFGARALDTPHIDGIGAGGVSFTRAYTASPICLPARCSLATGLYPHTTRSFSNIYGGSLDPELPNLFNLLRENGYRTSLHGKGHFMPCPYPYTDENMTKDFAGVKPFYTSLGIDHIDLQDDKNNSLWFYDDYSEDLERNHLLEACREARKGQSKTKSPGYHFPGPAEMHPDAWVGRKTLDYMEHADKDSPHLIWASFSGPHYPIDPPKEYCDPIRMDEDLERHVHEREFIVDNRSCFHSYHGPGGTEGSGYAEGGAQRNYDDDYWREWRRKYYGNVSLIDEYVGKILRKAESIWGEDLMIVFTTDHGDMMGNHGIWGKNGACYDDVLRVPLMIKFPAGIEGKNNGYIENQLVSHLDILPTILDVIGMEIPVRLQGISLKGNMEQERSYLLSEADGRFILITREGYKLAWTRNHNHNPKWTPIMDYWEFFDLNEDPHEYYNRYGQIEYHDRQILCERIFEMYKSEMDSVLFYEKGNPPPWFRG